MIDILVSIFIILIVMGLAYWIVTMLPLPEPFKQIAVVVVLVIFLLILLGMLFGGLPVLRMGR